MIYIYPYKLGSASAKALREGLSSVLGYRVKLVKPDGKFNPRRRDKVINWGMSTLPKWEMNLQDVNQCFAIKFASDKLASFQILTDFEVPTPEWTTDIEVAKTWFDKRDSVVFCRTVLNGHSGQGIVQSSSLDELVKAPLYVKYKKKKDEYRVHVFDGKVIDTQQKRKREGYKDNENFNSKVRNHRNGWVYCRDGITPCADRDAISIKAVQALGLDFGAVDIIYNERDNAYYVLEVNTAPGIDGTTIDNYVKAILQ